MDDVTLFQRLSTRSKRNFYDVYAYFDWQAELPADRYWLAPELLTVHGTEYASELSEATLMRLSQCETVNLFSIFTQGESDLLQTILKNCTREDFRESFEYLTHFVDEENKHMWFFAEFCRRYHGDPYPVRMLKVESAFAEDTERFLAFVRILVFEELGDFVNVRVARDERVPELVREIHRRHHEDEVGHIAAGWKIATRLLGWIVRAHGPSSLEGIKAYLESYMDFSIQNLYNPLAYREAGLPEPYALRTKLLEHPARVVVHDAMLRRTRMRLSASFAAACSGIAMDTKGRN